MPKTLDSLKGPFHFDGKDVFFDEERNEFWVPSEGVYLDHEIGLHLIELYFGHQNAPIGPSIKINRISVTFILSITVLAIIGLIFIAIAYFA